MFSLVFNNIKILSWLVSLWLILFFYFPVDVQAANLSGMILLDVERNGEAWYVYPEDNRRYYLGRPADAFGLMRELGLGINEVNFQKIASADMPVEGDLELARRLAGQIVIQTEKNGEAWYIYPKDLKKYYLGRPKDAFKIMRELGLGITREDLAKVHKPGATESLDDYSKYEHKKISTKSGIFTVDVVEIDLKNPDLKILTDTVWPYPTENKKTGSFAAQSLAKFVLSNKGFTGINGSYFEAYNSNQNYYFAPVYDSSLGKMINEDQLKYWTTGPVVVFDEDNKFYYFKDSRDFGSVEDFEKKHGVIIQAAIGNKPRLIENGLNQLIDWDIDNKQLKAKSDRAALGSKDNIVYLVVVKYATLPELADVMKEIGVEFALNLDGGYSSALWYNDEYMVKPGRDVPNAIIFSNK